MLIRRPYPPPVERIQRVHDATVGGLVCLPAMGGEPLGQDLAVDPGDIAMDVRLAGPSAPDHYDRRHPRSVREVASKFVGKPRGRGPHAGSEIALVPVVGILEPANPKDPVRHSDLPPGRLRVEQKDLPRRRDSDVISVAAVPVR
jgi:hypothetical protein